jgi:hypothetical protein
MELSDVHPGSTHHDAVEKERWRPKEEVDQSLVVAEICLARAAPLDFSPRSPARKFTEFTHEVAAPLVRHDQGTEPVVLAIPRDA